MSKEKKFLTCDGNQAAAHISYMFTEVAAIYPITPSSTMAEYVDEWAAAGRKNIFGETVLVQEMQSEGGAAGAVHGSLQAGALTTTYTASQGLLLMIPNMYKIAGEMLPSVFHVSARTIASHALSIFGDHQDVMAARQTGFAMLAEGSVQEVMDLSGVAHLATIKSRIPFLNFFDGFRTSHEIQKIEMLEQEDLAPLLDRDAVAAFRDRALNPDAPVARGMAENGDVFFQHRESCNPIYEAVPEIVEDYMKQISAITGREYHLFNYYGDPQAERVIIAMGSGTQAAQEAVDHLMAKGEKVGLVSVHLFRPFSAKHLLAAIPATAKRIAVLDRTKEPGAPGEPLYLDVCEVYKNRTDAPAIYAGRFGLASKDTTPADMIAVYDNLALPQPKDHFTIGIVDDVNFSSLPPVAPIVVSDTMFEAKFYGLGADGTVGANKNSVKIIGDNTNKYCQAYFAYDSKKSGGFTCSHLRFGDEPIRSTYLVTTPNFVACHVQAYLHLYDVTRGLRDGGTFLLNTIWKGEELAKNLPNKVKKYFADHNITVYYIDATKIAQEIGLGNRTNTILQSAFFRITEVIPVDLAVEQMKKFIVKSYGKKGQDVVDKNYAAVDRGGEYAKLDVDPSWSNLPEDAEVKNNDPEFINKLVRPINAQDGDLLKVSDFKGIEDGTWQQSTARYEKRGVATFVPEWIADNCIQCNKCAYVCPHAAIRPFVLDEKEMAGAPIAEGDSLPAIGKTFTGMRFVQAVDVLDCLGCGNCADVCPGKKGEKALVMKPLETQMDVQKEWDYCVNEVSSKQDLVDVKANVKNSQFAMPYFEFSGACSGCGETPYVKLISQLYGDHEMVANATGCSSIYSGSVPSTPYTVNKQGHGPAWGNSLFEDFAEFGLGMFIANEQLRRRLTETMKAATECPSCSQEIHDLAQQWLDSADDAVATRAIADKLIPLCEACGCDICKTILDLKHYIVKRSHWIIAGDGASYDIGFGGLDHVLASGKNINVLVVDTEVYSNTGGQASKATPVGAIAKFAASGKRIRKKDLGLIASTYGYVYCAQIAMGADQAQTLKAIREAEAYDGPSLIIAYAPCINHGIKAGMGHSQLEEQKAVECGYWHLWRYNPALEESGQNPFTLDSKTPDWDKFEDFLKGEVRYASLAKQYPAEASELFSAAKANAQWRYNNYRRLAQQQWGVDPEVGNLPK
ncbi:pyruvate:ferredoxin (flavodoxin) oxidoreductase [Paramuribaculum intestinale]|uniref:Pyruvate:ferredoxin (Flavodoxin) oxidoreductase n=4 Tax=Paramuribaculum intestinale TaxID=2094151 RepID=A0A2V1IWA5_9BACT|nr:pyruvate:ferredoxin (flavodoxin) oxidoreductase [Paramuribaculum intestinale]PWB06804.1 pyruvate:ferredoxin (flavodoxin) oxidoreductase [Paramuribaculum intestinale]PWB12636.1 pyruvate:ferredoxin (flavodoxin) oxidoreductase [Paramuribaculum intestinale]ROS94430.1 pyruvate:ferredoxin (flavodoxin) oxidoreductase [Muribaculaceae bacterium Isolate-043 (Harlan)]WLT41847.1 pyruvate:ferredoxin (flavodoxin) oxidoreductase [Paramuribaculum intestinale]